MATFEVRCPSCNSSYRVSGDAVGKSGRCKKCGESFRLKAASDTSKSAASETNAGHGDSTGTGRRLPEKVARFQIQRQLGEGGFGTVYLAFDPILERQVAVKVPHPHLLRKTEDRQRYLREAKTAARLRHAHIVPLLEATVEGDDLYIASAYIEGQPLDSLLRDRRASLDEALSWVIKLARALDYAHKQGIIHRDVKSGNIILDEHGEPLLMDFGLARIIASDEQLTQTDSVLGTPAYMSPEQAAGRIREISPATDQYSLGVLLYELISGKRPFTGPVGMVISLVINTPPPPPSDHDPSIPVELETICLRMMSKQIGERYPSLGEAARELEQFLKSDRGATVDNRISGIAAAPAISDTQAQSVTDVGRPSRKSANTEKSAKSHRTADQGSKDSSWRQPPILGGLGKRRIIEVAGVAAVLVLILVATGLKKTPDLAGNPSVINQSSATVEPAVVNPTPSPAVSPPASEPATNATLYPAPALQESVPATATPRAVPNSMPQSQRAPTAARQSQSATNRFTPQPPASPQLAIAPFSEAEAKSHQVAWSDYLGQPVELTNSIGMKLMLIPPGEFMMGSPENEAERLDDEMQHRVRITKPYYLGMHEATQADYERVMGTNPSFFSAGGAGKEKINGINTSRLPVENVSWNDAVEFCRRLSAMPSERSAGRVYRLPTEAQWENACRAGTTTPFHFGSQLAGQQANFNGNYPYGTTTKVPYLGRTALVGSYGANGYGLFDMHGNAMEWCANYYDDYATSTRLDPTGPVSGLIRVLRGGGWGSSSKACRSASRTSLAPGNKSSGFGFRLALSLVIDAVPDIPESASDMASSPASADIESVSTPTESKLAPPAEQQSQQASTGGTRNPPQLPAAPKLAIAPFSEAEAKSHQAAWSAYLDQPVELTNSIGMKLTLIPPGQFKMGAYESPEEIYRLFPESNLLEYKVEIPRHSVTLTSPFRIAAHEVRVSDFELFVNATGYRTTAEVRGNAWGLKNGTWQTMNGLNWRDPGFPQERSHPVTCVSWHDATAFCDWLSDKEGRKYWLPTESQWEYACRAGTETQFFWGDNPNSGNGYLNAADLAGSPDGRAWRYRFNFNDGYVFTSPVGTYKPNAFGLFDMSGNVWEWCSDRYVTAESLDRVSPAEPAMPSKHVRRGGGWLNTAGKCRSAHRYGDSPVSRFNDIGFRVAITSEVQLSEIVSASNVATTQKEASPTKTTFSEDDAEMYQLAWARKAAQPVELTNSLGMKMMLIPPGEFMIGSPEDEAGRRENEKQYGVSITQPIYLGMHEVTQQHYKYVMDKNPSHFSIEGLGKDAISGVDTLQLPVENVSWTEATEFCRLLSEWPSELAAGRAYRLPYEAEWEYACRAGTNTPFNFGKQISESLANINNEIPSATGSGTKSIQRTTLVGSYKANGFGLFDMHGNVSELCADNYIDYPVSNRIDPIGSLVDGARVGRGGSWLSGADRCRAAYRAQHSNTCRHEHVGFRVVCVPDAIKPADKSSSLQKQDRDDAASEPDLPEPPRQLGRANTLSD